MNEQTKELLEQTDEQLVDKTGSPCPEFWDWLPRAYRDGDVGVKPQFTKYNMEVAYLAGRQAKQNLGKPEPNLQDNEQYRLQMAAICTAAIGYWKESDSICPEYDTLALRDVAKLYVKYAALCDKLAQLEQMLLKDFVKIPTLSHGVLVKLSDVEAIIKRIKP